MQKMTSLSRLILEEQIRNKWPGLVSEVQEICKELNIQDLSVDDVSANTIKQAVFDHHYKELKETIAKSKKMEKHKDENYKEIPEYMKGKSVENCRMAFRIKCEMVEEIRGNYKSKYRRMGGEDALLCPDCPSGQIQTQMHCLVCP